MKSKFWSNYDKLLEGYGQIKEIRRMRFPRGLQGRLSEEFVTSLQLEFKRLTSPVIEEDDDGVKTKKKPCPKKVMEQLQKALPFIVRS
tara:strand:- start:3705 stop:3968 length:264 start_codon:yes stop_codon:yes gene_type:complete